METHPARCYLYTRVLSHVRCCPFAMGKYFLRDKVVLLVTRTWSKSSMQPSSLVGGNHAKVVSCGQGSERKFSRGYEGRYRAPKFYRAPQVLSGPMPLNHFLFAGCRSSFKSEEITIFAYLGFIKYTIRHKIGLNLARGCGGAL